MHKPLLYILVLLKISAFGQVLLKSSGEIQISGTYDTIYNGSTVDLSDAFVIKRWSKNYIKFSEKHKGIDSILLEKKFLEFSRSNLQYFADDTITDTVAFPIVNINSIIKIKDCEYRHPDMNDDYISFPYWGYLILYDYNDHFLILYTPLKKKRRKIKLLQEVAFFDKKLKEYYTTTYKE